MGVDVGADGKEAEEGTMESGGVKLRLREPSSLISDVTVTPKKKSEK